MYILVLLDAITSWSQSVAALVGVVFTALLYRVSRDQLGIAAQQRDISERQQKVMERQNAMFYDIERGRLTETSFTIKEGEMRFILENTGRSHLDIVMVRYRGLSTIPRTSLFDDWLEKDAHYSRSFHSLSPGEALGERPGYSLPDECYNAQRGLLTTSWIYMVVYYRTMGTLRAYRWLNVIDASNQGLMGTTKATRWLAPGFEADEVKDGIPDDNS